MTDDRVCKSPELETDRSKKDNGSFFFGGSREWTPRGSPCGTRTGNDTSVRMERRLRGPTTAGPTTSA